ncbi:TonB-dependent receptor plug domain-containing protein [Beggiatoa leptomitoformis]|uniref:TonB-dependent receptor n=1 Tax=Beggiatoa leptomitoformis TaxID=288004 RepID=A0A2N9YDG3_9GAMM|nr:TonB-dependent receptor [Beggiatoa leptomitoformis]ALG69063.1 TonB-dependent receptor [Beggiatoa leptomitoformis]AUI68528.1 TonB-dependent receptor [Beggiatoa leptomitoformis]
MRSSITLIYPFLLLMVLSLIIVDKNVYATDEETILEIKHLSLEELMEVEVTSIATGTTQEINKAPATTTVITASDIAALGAQTLDEVLATVPGIQVSRNFFNYAPYYSVRGVHSSPYNPHVLMLRDGIPITSLYNGGRLLTEGSTPIRDLARIEIIRGPGSAMYGADAFSAVINLITKSAADINGTEAGARIGSFDTYETWLLHGDKWRGIETSFSLQYRDTDGDKSLVQEDFYSQIDKLYGTKSSLAPGSVSRSEEALDLQLGLSTVRWQWHGGTKIRRNLGNGMGILQSVDPEGRYQSDQIYTDLTYQIPTKTDDWEVSVQGNYHQQRWHADKLLLVAPAGALGYYDGISANVGTSEVQSRFNLNAFYKGWQQHLIRLGMGYQYGDLYNVTDVRTYYPELPEKAYLLSWSNSPNSFLESGIRQNWHAFIQDAYNFAPHWELTTGLRYDYYSDFGTTLNPRIALVWQTTPTLTSKLLYGQAFRAPAFLELYGRNNPVSLGNKELEPETIKTIELGFNYRPVQTLQTDLNLFYYQFDEGIGYLPVIPPPDNYPQAFLAQNVATQKGKGFEWQVKWQALDNLLLSGHYAFQDNKQTSETADEGSIPHPAHSAYFRTDWLFAPHWKLNLQVQWTGERERIEGDPRPPVADYTLTHLTLHYTPAPKPWEVTAGIRNVFDEYATEPSLGVNTQGILPIPYDLPLEGRTYFLEFNYRFQ